MNKLNEEFDLFNEGFSNYENTLELPRHRWYYYKEGFSPFLVESAIEQSNVKKSEIIIDPFNGSGTTTLTSSLNGYTSFGIEVNPFTAFLSDAKLKNADVGKLRLVRDRIINYSGKSAKSDLLGYSTFSKTDKNKKWLFNDDVLNTFQTAWNEVEGTQSLNLNKLSKLALIISAMHNCNAKRDGKCFRYRDSWAGNGFNSDTFLQSVEASFNKIIEDVENQPIKTKSIIINGDCRKVLDNTKFEKFKLCVTSPPYLNTFDYTDIYRPELFLGKFINNQEDLYNLRLSTVRSHIQAKWTPPVRNNFGLLYHQTITYLNANLDNLMDKNIPIMVQAYFEDMFNILRLLREKADKNAQVWFVVSNSAYADQEIPVDLIIGDIASKAGWYLKEIGVLRYIQKRKTKYSTSVKELRESVIILHSSKY